MSNVIKVFLCLLVSIFIGISIASDSYLIAGILSVGLLLINVYLRMSLDKVLLVLVSIYWLPLVKLLTPISSLYDMYVFEAGVYLLFFISIRRILKKDGAFLKWHKMFLLGCLFFISGALIANFPAGLSGLLIARLRLNLILPIVIFFVVGALIKNHTQLKNLALAYAFTTGFIALLFFLFWWFGLFAYTNSSLEGARLGILIRSSLFRDNLEFEPTTLATTFAIPLPFILGLLTNEKKLTKKYLLIASFCATCVLLAFTQGRAGWLAGGCGCFVLLLLRSKEISRKAVSFAGVGVFAYTTILVLKPLWNQQYSNVDIAQRFFTLIDNPLTDPNYVFRVNQYAQRWELILKNPLGINLIDVYTPQYYVHSMYLFLAIGVGLIGLLGFLLMLVSGLITHLRTITRADSSTNSHLYASIGLGSILTWMIGGLSEPVGLISGLSPIVIWLSYFLSLKGSTLLKDDGQ